jgi:ABC-type sulfate transport system permease component
MKDFLENSKTTTAFGIVALLAGILFINQTLTGNAVLTNSTNFNAIPVVGIGLLLCSFVMFLYTLKKIKG